jgi:hypothetical protein
MAFGCQKRANAGSATWLSPVVVAIEGLKDGLFIVSSGHAVRRGWIQWRPP